MTTMTDFNMDMSRDYGVKENMMPNGDKLAIFRVANTSLYRVAHAGNAKPLSMGPEYSKDHGALLGMFTVPGRAQEAIEKYLRTVWDNVKGVKDHKSKPLTDEEITVRSDKEHRAKA